MDNSTIVSWIFNILMGVLMFFMKDTYDTNKGDIKEVKLAIDLLKEQKMSKVDFSEFKQELWGRLDKIDNTIERHMK